MWRGHYVLEESIHDVRTLKRKRPTCARGAKTGRLARLYTRTQESARCVSFRKGKKKTGGDEPPVVMSVALFDSSVQDGTDEGNRELVSDAVHQQQRHSAAK